MQKCNPFTINSLFFCTGLNTVFKIICQGLHSGSGVSETNISLAINIKCNFILFLNACILSLSHSLSLPTLFKHAILTLLLSKCGMSVEDRLFLPEIWIYHLQFLKLGQGLQAALGIKIKMCNCITLHSKKAIWK